MASRFGVVGVVLLAPFLIGSCGAQLKAGCKLETLGACGDDFVPYAKTTHLPSSGEAFNKICRMHAEQIACCSKFVNDCMEGVTKAASTVVVAAFKENLEGACNVTSPDHKAFGKAVGCLNSVGAKINSCWKSYKGDLQKTVVKAHAKDMIHYACCSFHDLFSCMEQSLTPCESSGGKQFGLQFLQALFGDAVRLVCGEYTKGSHACKTLPKLAALGANDRKVDNYIQLLAEVATTLGRKN